MRAPIFDLDPPEPTRLGEVVRVEPYPGALLSGLDEPTPGPEVQYEARVVISLAFVMALQFLPPRQRVVLILRDVLGFPAREVASLLDTTLESVTSALKQARTGLRRQFPPSGQQEPPPPPDSPAERRLVERLAHAYQNGAVDDLAVLLSEDVRLIMPPVPPEYQGREQAARFLARISFRNGRTYRLVPTRANGQLAFAAYVPDPSAGLYRADGLLVLTLAGSLIHAMGRFDAGALSRFELPLPLSA